MPLIVRVNRDNQISVWSVNDSQPLGGAAHGCPGLDPPAHGSTRGVRKMPPSLDVAPNQLGTRLHHRSTAAPSKLIFEPIPPPSEDRHLLLRGR